MPGNAAGWSQAPTANNEMEGKEMLKCERNTKAMASKVLTAARVHFRQRKNISATYEHGQWYIIRIDENGDCHNYSVCDAEGIGTTNGFSFEHI